jgi:hypothetical protein
MNSTSWRVFRKLRAMFLVLSYLCYPKPALAYEFPLSSEEIRQAYFFGRSSDGGRVLEFLGQYVRLFRPDNTVSFVGRIELRTPFQRIVESSRNNQIDYSAQQAQIDYASKSDIVEVRVYLVFDASRAASPELYTDAAGHVLDHRENFWRDFRFHVTQDHAIEPKKIDGIPRYDCCGGGLGGALVQLNIDSIAVGSRELRVEVIAPDGHTTTASFALGELK